MTTVQEVESDSSSKRQAERRLKILVLSRNYPNNVLAFLGLWVEGLTKHSIEFCDSKVISPVPYCPPLPGLGAYARFRTIERRRVANGVEAVYPRFLVPPGQKFHAWESVTYHLSAMPVADRIRRDFPFDLIHGHFSYPDGFVAARLGRRYKVPVIITEHAPWKPWMEKYPRVLRLTRWAFNECAFHVSVSTSVRDEVKSFMGDSDKQRVIPCGVDGSVFTLDEEQSQSKNRILFAGAIRPVKGVDVLLRAVRLLVGRGRCETLAIIGESYYQSYQNEYARIRQMAIDLGLRDRVQFLGGKTQTELARYMQQSDVLVFPSRKESFGMVLVESLACGTPVVATRSGGPEDIVNEKVGVLVPPEDPEALADAIQRVLQRPEDFNRADLRTYALAKFSWNRISKQYLELYQEAIARHDRARSV
jgi:teichuronic acid biosynthesis glycosyltransferase TuaC